MKKLLLIAAAWLAIATCALAQTQVVTQPSTQAATNFSSTITVTNTFQSVLAASTKRQGCSIQNNGTHTMWVYFGPIANATKGASIILGAGQGMTCGSEGVVAKDQVSITGTGTDAFFATQDGAPTIGPTSSLSASFTPSGTQDVNLTQVAGASVATGHGTAAGAIRVELPTDGTGIVGLAAGSAVIGHVVTDSGSTTAVTGNVTVVQPTGTNLHAVLDSTSTTAVTQATAANLNATVVGTGTFAVQAQPTPVTSGGLSTSVIEPAASDNHANIKNGAGQVYSLTMFNNSATINYWRLYNAATGFDGCNSATNLVAEGHIPASTSDAGFVVDWSQGIAFSTGISICVTGAYGQTNTTNATASAISITVGYK